jgi:hypothetical protein
MTSALSAGRLLACTLAAACALLPTAFFGDTGGLALALSPSPPRAAAALAARGDALVFAGGGP